HRGDLTTITEAILAHGGEGRASRDAFSALPKQERDAIVEFLKSLQVLPEGASTLVVSEKTLAGESGAVSSAATVARESLGTDDR
ncbi:MAG: di-heme oxidoredictase family protein, partial [Actinomycetota bacterium]